MVPEAGEHGEGKHKGGALALCETVQLLAQCHRQLRRLLSDRLGVLGLNDSEFMVLWLCQQAEPRGWVQRDLAAALGISPPQISGLVERLRQQGWLTSRRCQLDRRRQVWGIEPEGSRLLARIGDDLQDLTASLDCSLSARRQTELTTLLRELAGWGAACPASAVKSGGDVAESSPLRLYWPDCAPQKQEEDREEMHDAIAMRKTG
jgi:DNA-binding MarR family transcriptional regulator